jgi:hypothetical protein
MSVCNVPVGLVDYVLGYLEQQQGCIKLGYKKDALLISPDCWSHPEVLIMQMLSVDWVATG